MADPIRIPVIRRGTAYTSFDLQDVTDFRSGAPVAAVMQANAGLIRRDLKNIHESFERMQSLSVHDLLAICKRAGELFMNEALPVDLEGRAHTPREFVECLSASSGLPYSLCRKNMAKIYEVFREMPTILSGLTRGLDLEVLDEGVGEQAGTPVSFYPVARSLGVILPSNSPGVNSIWMPAVALKIPVVLKPGREEPWTPYRIIQAFIAAGCPPEAFCFYPTSHEGAGTIMAECGRSILFGDENTVSQYARNPAVQVHGPGWSKIVIGDDQADRWEEYLEILFDSITQNGGRSCVNASAIVTPKHGQAIANALAERLAAIKPVSIDRDDALLSAFVNTTFAERIDQAIEAGLATPGARDVTARYRSEPRLHRRQDATYLLPTLVYCDTFEHPLANREFLFPYASVVELPQAKTIETIGNSLVVTALTEDSKFIKELLRAPTIQRLNLGPIPTSKVSWDQPHEGNLFEFLYQRRAVQWRKKPVAVCSV